MADSASKKSNAALRSFAFVGNLGGFIFPIGAIALVSVPGIWAYQVTQWLETGRWTEISVADALRWAQLPPPRFEWTALQQASENLMESPLSLVLLFGIGGVLWSYALFSKWLEKRCEPEKAAFE